MLRPTSANLFVTEAEVKTTTSTGIILTGGIDTGLKPAVVVATGPDALSEIGSKCYVNWKDAQPVTYDGVQGAIISEESVLAYID
jgi:co-chaperonin GroES (HSP10)